MDKPTYEVTTFENGYQNINRTDPDGKIWSISTDPANSDYQAYLESLKEGQE